MSRLRICGGGSSGNGEGLRAGEGGGGGVFTATTMEWAPAACPVEAHGAGGIAKSAL